MQGGVFLSQTNLVGEEILGYTVKEVLGSGAFGTVYKVVKTNVAGQYIRALKHITIPTEKQYYSVLDSMGGDVAEADNYFAQMLSNIVTEIQIMNELSEKGASNIVRYYESDIQTIESPKRYNVYILMEYLTSFDDYIRDAEFYVRDVIQLGLEVLNGLKVCHDNDIVHRDIKDDNIFITKNGEYKIGDFGVAKVLKDTSRAETLKGAPNFLAPEVYLGNVTYSNSVDLYSLGIVLYRLLNYNRNPFLPFFPDKYTTEDEEKAFATRMSGKTPDFPLLGGEDIGAVIVKAISNSNERFQSVDEFKGALENALHNTSKEILDASIKYNSRYGKESEESESSREYDETLAVDNWMVNCEKQKESKKDNEKDDTIHKSLFATISEVKPPVPESKPLEEQSEKCLTGIDKLELIACGILTIAEVCGTFLLRSYTKYVKIKDWLFESVDSILRMWRDTQNGIVLTVAEIQELKILSWLWVISTFILLISPLVFGRMKSKK